MKKLLVILYVFLLSFSISFADAPVIATANTTTPSQAKEFLRDRNATDEMIDCVDYVYDYCDDVGIDATLIIAQSSIETGYGKSHLCQSYNNVGGMKASKGGWMKFKTLKDGYKAMIDKIAVMAGVKKSSSYYYNSCYYIRDLGNIYWVESGCDAGYYSLLCKQMNTIKSYKVTEVEEPKEEVVEEKKEEEPIIVKKEEHKLTPTEYLMSFTKNKKKSGLDIIYKAIGKER